MPKGPLSRERNLGISTISRGGTSFGTRGRAQCLCVPRMGQMGQPPGGSPTSLGALSPNSAGTSVNAEADNKLSDDLNELVLTPIPDWASKERGPGIFAETGAGAATHSNTSGRWLLLFSFLGLVGVSRRRYGHAAPASYSAKFFLFGCPVVDRRVPSCRNTRSCCAPTRYWRAGANACRGRRRRGPLPAANQCQRL